MPCTVTKHAGIRSLNLEAAYPTGMGFNSAWSYVKESGDEGKAVTADKRTPLEVIEEPVVGLPKGSTFQRVFEPGKPQFQLNRGEEGLSVFLESQVKPGQILPSYRPGSQIASKTIEQIEALGLRVVKCKGDPTHPALLQQAHYEIRPGQGMEGAIGRTKFKKALKRLEQQLPW